MSDGNEVLSAMQYEVKTGEEECIVMLDSDGEGR